MNRTCGPCTACCTHLNIPLFNKPAHIPCQHLTCNCEIYKVRPSICKDYVCAWLNGDLPESEEYRPDNLELILRFTERRTLIVHETKAGKINEHREWIRETTRPFPDITVFLVYYSGSIVTFSIGDD